MRAHHGLVLLAVLSGCPDDSPSGVDPDASVFTGKRVFVTAATFTGDLGGAAGADGECTTAATAAGRTGTWKAWVSTTAEDAIDRMADVGPWLDYSNQTIFASKAAMTSPPSVVLNTDEAGFNVVPSPMRTGTAADGTLSVNGNCADWTDATIDVFGNAGQVANDTVGWTDQAAITCAQQGHLICFEQ